MNAIFAILFLLFGIAQLVVGGMGIEYYFGGFWLGVAIVLVVFFRFNLPIIIGSYFGAVELLQWHWALALLFAVPGLLFIVPSFIAMIIESFRR